MLACFPDKMYNDHVLMHLQETRKWSKDGFHFTKKDENCCGCNVIKRIKPNNGGNSVIL